MARRKCSRQNISGLLDELGRIPSKEEVERYARAARVLYKAVLGLHFERKHQKKHGEIPLF